MPVLKLQCDPTSDRFQNNIKANLKLIENLKSEIQKAQNQASEKAIQKFRDQGKLLTRERIQGLLDVGSPFLEFSQLAAWGLYENSMVGACCVTGLGTVSGKLCMILSSDPLIKGGASNPMTVQKYLRAQEFAFENQLPCLHLVESAGANLNYAGDVFVPGGAIFKNITKASASGQAQIALVFGSSTAGGAYIPGLCDQIVMVKDQAMLYLGGPPLVKMATGEDADDESLGGAQMHSTVSGVSDYLAENDEHALRLGREIISHLPKATTPLECKKFLEPIYNTETLLGVVSPDPRYPYDVRDVIACLVDGSEFDEFKPLYGGTLVTGFAHIKGEKVGLIANNGILFSESSQKGTHFIELCNQRKIPIVFLMNITGFMVGEQYETGGIVKHGANMINAVTNSTVPHITMILGAAHGAGYYAMCGRPFDPAYIAAWPCSKTSVMGPDQAAGVMAQVRRASLEKQGEAWSAEEEEQFKAPIKYMFEQQANPLFATGKLYDDGVIDPRETRTILSLILEAVKTRQSKKAHYGVMRF